MTQDALASIGTMATGLQVALTGLQSVSSPAAVAALSATAASDLQELTGLLNTQSDGKYVFAGSASDQPPVNSADLNQSGLVSGIVREVAQVAISGSETVESATLAAASSASADSAFSAQLSVSPSTAAGLVPQVNIGQGLVVASGMAATQGADIVSTTSTGSPIRDLIRALATVKGLAGADSTTSQFKTLLNDTTNAMPAISTALADLSGSLGEQQATLATQAVTLSNMSDALNTQINTFLVSDPATVRTQQVALQNQLTASYNLIADMKTLSLADYI